MKNPITKFSIAAMVFIAIVLGISVIPGNNSNQLFANVMDNVLQANSVSYNWTIKHADRKPSEYTCMINDLCVKRTHIPGGDVQLHDYKTGSHLHLFAGGFQGKGTYAELTLKIGKNKSKHPFAYLDWISKIHKIDAQYVGIEELKGVQYKMYTRKFPYEETKIWVNPKTDLPFRIVIESYPNEEKDMKRVRLVLRESDFGGSGEYTRSFSGNLGGRSNGIQKRKTQIYSDLEWNVEFDDSLFSMEAPENYTVKVMKVDDSSKKYRNWTVEALAFWTDMSDGHFPDDIRDMITQEKVIPLIIKKFDRDGNPREEMDRAIKQMEIMARGIGSVMRLKEDNWHYQGMGVIFGASDVPVCWWKNGDSPDSPYAVIYGDLSMVLVETPPQTD